MIRVPASPARAPNRARRRAGAASGPGVSRTAAAPALAAAPDANTKGSSRPAWGPAGQAVVAVHAGGQGQGGRGAGQPAGEEVGGDGPPPHRGLEDGLVVVGAHVGVGDHGRLPAPASAPPSRGGGRHRPDPAKAAATPAASETAAAAAARHIPATARVVTAGSGGRPSTSG